MNRTLLRKVYRLHGIKKKYFRRTKHDKDHDPEEYQKKFITMKRLLTRYKNDGYRFIYADETMITRTTVKPTEWTRKKENMTID